MLLFPQEIAIVVLHCQDQKPEVPKEPTAGIFHLILPHLAVQADQAPAVLAGRWEPPLVLTAVKILPTQNSVNLPG